MNLAQKQPPSSPDTLITPEGGHFFSYLRSLLTFRELLAFLVWKDLKVQVAHTALGIGWFVLRPVLNALVLTLIFGRLARLPSEGHPYLLFLLAGYLPWSYFSGVAGKSVGVLTGNTSLITKVYFPRALLPLSLLLSGLVELAVTLTLFLLLAAIGFAQFPGVGLVWLLIPLLLLLITTAGVGFWLAALAARYRDVRQAAGYLLQMLMFLAPVLWPLSLLPTRLGLPLDGGLAHLAIGLYPMVGAIEGCRRALLGGPMPWDLLAVSFAAAIVLFATGIAYFQKHEQQLADKL